MLVRLALLVLALAALAAPSAALADGLPVLGVDVGGTGVASGDARYVTIPAGGDTVVARLQRNGGRVDASAVLRGRFTIPAVAYDFTAAGLSADGSTLVLIRPRVTFPQKQTTLALVDAGRLRLRRVVTLAGDYSFDAVSPRGLLVYLIHYVTPRDPNRYEVRAYDVRRARLLPRPIVDPSGWDGAAMRGRPLSRATTSDGRFAYTLYDGAGGTPFVHALDTTRHTARCIDLAGLAGKDLSRLRLRLDHGQLLVVGGGSDLAVSLTEP